MKETNEKVSVSKTSGARSVTQGLREQQITTMKTVIKDYNLNKFTGKFAKIINKFG